MTEPLTGTGGESVAVAIVGLACRFPGAPNVATFWQNLLAGVASITHFTDAELEIPATSPADVRARGFLPDADQFDAEFFALPPREAELLDPQARVLLELAWEALEHAGHGEPASLPRTGVFVGASLPTYLLNNVLPAAGPGGAMDLATQYQQTGRADFLGNGMDMIAKPFAVEDLAGRVYTMTRR